MLFFSIFILDSHLMATQNPVVKELIKFTSQKILQYFIEEVHVSKKNLILNREKTRLWEAEMAKRRLQAMQESDDNKTRGAALLSSPDQEEGCEELNKLLSDLFEQWLVNIDSKKSEFAQSFAEFYNKPE